MSSSAPKTLPGDTPLIEVGGIYAKLECTNPCGSVKDRIAHYIIAESEKQGLLKPGMKIVEATSGNTGISLTYFASQKGYSTKMVMPKNMTDERKKIIQGLGGELVLCAEGDFSQAAQIRNEIAENPEYFNPDQFSNPLNIECHERTTGQEILSQIKEHAPSIDAFVAGVGTGGTLMGVGKALRKTFPDVHLVAVEPAESPVMSGGEAGLHGINGIGDGFIPAIVCGTQGKLHEMIDEVVCVSTSEAKQMALHIQEEFGYCVGISSGANYVAAKKLTEKYKTVVTMFPDGYGKYQSEGLKHCANGRCEYEHPDRIMFAYQKE